MEQQSLNLERVRERIAKVILAFLHARIALGHPEFHMVELVAFVRECIPNISPDSSSRILRDMRQRGEITYALVSRRASLYRIERAA